MDIQVGLWNIIFWPNLVEGEMQFLPFWKLQSAILQRGPGAYQPIMEIWRSEAKIDGFQEHPNLFLQWIQKSWTYEVCLMLDACQRGKFLPFPRVLFLAGNRPWVHYNIDIDVAGNSREVQAPKWSKRTSKVKLFKGESECSRDV